MPMDDPIPKSPSNDEEHGVLSLSGASVQRLHSRRSTSSSATDQGEDCGCREEESDAESDPKILSARSLKLSSMDFLSGFDSQ